MGSCRTTCCFVAVFLGWLMFAGPTQAQQGNTRDETAIRAVMERTNLSVNADTVEKGVEIMKGILSDKGYTFVIPNPAKPSEALVSDKRGLLEALSQSLQNGPRWGNHKVKRIVVVGPLAYEVGETKSPQDAEGQGTSWFNVLAKEDVGWRIVCSTPAEGFQKALRQLSAYKGESAK